MSVSVIESPGPTTRLRLSRNWATPRGTSWAGPEGQGEELRGHLALSRVAILIPSKTSRTPDGGLRLFEYESAVGGPTAGHYDLAEWLQAIRSRHQRSENI